MPLVNRSSPKIPKKSAWISLFYILCLLNFCCLLVASVIILSTLPVYLSTRDIPYSSLPNEIPTLNASYFVVSGDVHSLVNINSIDRTRTSRSFAKGLKLPGFDSLQIQHFSTDTISASNRRKRRYIDGVALIFQFDLHYPSRLSCQTNTCKNRTFNKIYQQFQTIAELDVELAGNIVQLKLCSLGILSIIDSTSNPTIAQSNYTSSASNGGHNLWMFATNMSSARYRPSTTLVTKENLIIISGSSSISDFPSASRSMIDTLDEKGNLISSQNLTYMRNFHTTNYLPSSDVILFAGGINIPDGTKLNNAELFNLTTGRRTLIEMSSVRFDHQSIAIDSAKTIVLIGGTDANGTVSSSGDVFDGQRFTSVLNRMTHGRRYHTITYLPTIRKVLIVGGETTVDCAPKMLNTIELYNIDTNMFESLPNITLSSARSLHTATYIPSPYDQVLILGGSSNGTDALNTYEIFDVSSFSFIKNGTISSPRVAHTATLLPNNIDILLVGGYSSNEAIDISYQPIAPCELFHIPTTSTTILANMTTPRAFHTSILLPTTSNVLCCGGVDSHNTPLSSCERYQS